jgi:hypothetical protein
MTIDEACERLNMAEDLLGDVLGYLDGNEWGVDRPAVIAELKAYFDFKKSGRSALVPSPQQTPGA